MSWTIIRHEPLTRIHNKNKNRMPAAIVTGIAICKFCVYHAYFTCLPDENTCEPVERPYMPLSGPLRYLADIFRCCMSHHILFRRSNQALQQEYNIPQGEPSTRSAPRSTHVLAFVGSWHDTWQDVSPWFGHEVFNPMEPPTDWHWTTVPTIKIRFDQIRSEHVRESDVHCPDAQLRPEPHDWPLLVICKTDSSSREQGPVLTVWREMIWRASWWITGTVLCEITSSILWGSTDLRWWRERTLWSATRGTCRITNSTGRELASGWIATFGCYITSWITIFPSFDNAVAAHLKRYDLLVWVWVNHAGHRQLTSPTQ